MTHKPALPASLHLVELASVGSTNDHAKGLAKSGYPTGTVVWAHEQTTGKGRLGNTWTSYPGNLYMSLILRPDMNAALTGQLSFLAAVALAETLKPLLYSNAQIGLKWPNDLLLNGKKAAGILLETEAHGVNSVGYVIIGIGVNIAGCPEGATSLQLLGVDTSAGLVLEKLGEKIMSLYQVWKNKGFDPIRTAWMEHAANIGGQINVRLPKETLQGKFLGIDRTGALQLEMADSTVQLIASGEVYL